VTTEPEPWTSVDGVAVHLGVAKDSVYRWIEKRGLPAHRIGRLWKFKLSEVDAWVRSGGAVDTVDDSATQS
jgi:excisionase family DNA binding protein